jgi:hypothetical protein
VEKTVSIAGGGLAGLARGIRLRQQGLPVRVHEAGHYPLKKVCGEFLSPQGWRRVQALGAAEGLNPVPLRKARFYAGDADCFDFSLDPPAWGLSRAALDSALARRFQELGGELLEGSRVDADGLDVDATGRPAARGGEKWMGWKAYLDAGQAPVELDQVDLLMLPVTGGYCGLSRIEDGRVSVCLAARAPVELAALLGSHPLLAPLAPFLKAHAAIANFDFSTKPGTGRLGDARRVWPPVVGDGMSQALAAGEGGTTDFQFLLAKGLHHLMLSRRARRLAAFCCRLFPSLPSALYRLSRG